MEGAGVEEARPERCAGAAHAKTRLRDHIVGFYFQCTGESLQGSQRGSDIV